MHVWNLLHAARWKCRTQKVAKNCRLGTIAQLCRAISSQPRHVSTIGKKLLSSDMSSTCPHNMVNFGLLTSEIHPVVWGTPANFNWFRVLAALLHGIYSSGRQPNFAGLNRGRHLCSAGRPSRWALAHILVIIIVMFIYIYIYSSVIFEYCYVMHCVYTIKAQHVKHLTFVVFIP